MKIEYVPSFAYNAWTPRDEMLRAHHFISRELNDKIDALWFARQIPGDCAAYLCEDSAGYYVSLELHGAHGPAHAEVLTLARALGEVSLYWVSDFDAYRITAR